MYGQIIISRYSRWRECKYFSSYIIVNLCHTSGQPDPDQAKSTEAMVDVAEVDEREDKEANHLCCFRNNIYVDIYYIIFTIGRLTATTIYWNGASWNLHALIPGRGRCLQACSSWKGVVDIGRRFTRALSPVMRAMQSISLLDRLVSSYSSRNQRSSYSCLKLRIVTWKKTKNRKQKVLCHAQWVTPISLRSLCKS